VFLPAGIIMLIAKILNINSTIQILLATMLLVLYGVYLMKTDATIRDMLVSYKLLKKA